MAGFLYISEYNNMGDLALETPMEPAETDGPQYVDKIREILPLLDRADIEFQSKRADQRRLDFHA